MATRAAYRSFHHSSSLATNVNDFAFYETKSNLNRIHRRTISTITGQTSTHSFIDILLQCSTRSFSLLLFAGTLLLSSLRHASQVSSLTPLSNMTAKSKRKWRWNSRSLFTSASPNKTVKLDHTIIDTQDGTTDYHYSQDMLLDGHGSEQSQLRTGMAARLRRNGSKLLSLVGLQRNGDSCQSRDSCFDVAN